LVILGAGSAGALGAYRGAEPLSYYVVGLTPLAGARWEVSVSGRKIDDSGGRFAASAYYAFRTETGPPSGEPPFATFQATTTRESHAAIAAAIPPNTSVANFLSVVEHHAYEHPPTAKIGAQPATKEQVIDCFRTLHPEWSTTYRDWSNKEAVDDRLRSLPARFQFRHGPRLFGRDFVRGTPISDAPIRQAVSSLSTAKKTRAFVGLYRVSDASSDREPMPGLMSVQFIREDRTLDVVATFRKLELSFWWAVNMFELDQLLRWAAEASRERLVPRRITFFATIAEWKSDPEAAFVAKLDNLGVENMVPLVLQIARREVPALSELAELLEEKARAINEANIDDAGLERLVAVARGIGRVSGTGAWFPPLINHLEVALGHMKSALADLDRREPNLEESRKQLADATSLLRTTAKTRPT
jgi:hypothetical protein